MEYAFFPGEKVVGGRDKLIFKAGQDLVLGDLIGIN